MRGESGSTSLWRTQRRQAYSTGCTVSADFQALLLCSSARTTVGRSPIQNSTRLLVGLVQIAVRLASFAVAHLMTASGSFAAVKIPSGRIVASSSPSTTQLPYLGFNLSRHAGGAT